MEYGGFSGDGESGRDVRDRWWYQDDEYELATKLLEHVDTIDDETQARQIGIFDRMVRLYGDEASVPRGVPLTRYGSGERRRPIAANICDTLVAEISKDRPRPMFVTAGGSWDERRTAEHLTAACDWVFGRQLMVPKARRAALDAIIGGAGFARPVQELDGTVSLERCFAPDVLMDDSSCIDTMPRDIYHRRFLDRAMVWELYPEHRDIIESAHVAGWSLTNPHSPSADIVEVIEGWHLPSFQGEIDGRTAEDGHWAMVLRTGGDRQGGLLDHGEYTRPHFPIVGMRSLAPSAGWWGIPMIDRPAASDFELNKLYRRIAENMHKVSCSRVYIEEGSNVSPADIQNTIGAIIKHTGPKPIFDTPQAMNAEVYQHSERLEAAGHKDAGVSEYAASSTIPANLESGRAQRIFREQMTLRQVVIFDEYEGFHCELARRWVDAEAELAEDSNQEREMAYEVNDCRETIKWSRVAKALDGMTIVPMPTSGLATTPAARMQEIQDGVKDGLFTPEDSLRLSTDPDTKAIREERLAATNRLHKVLDGMLDGGPYVGPDPEMDLVRGVPLALAKINNAVVRDCPPDRINNLRTWWTEAKVKRDQAQAAAAADAAPPGPGVPLPEGATELLGAPPGGLGAAALGQELGAPGPVGPPGAPLPPVLPPGGGMPVA
jgi:hypothetical protein